MSIPTTQLRALLAVLLLSLVATASADARITAFSARAKGTVYVFKPRGVNAREVVGATVVVARVRRSVDVRAVRRAVVRRSKLRVRVASAVRARRAVLRLRLDRTPPQTTITQAPSGSLTDRSAQVSFASSEDGSRFECRLDRTAWRACTPGTTLSGLAPGDHTFMVRAIDAAGNVDRMPAARTWRIVSVPALVATAGAAAGASTPARPVTTPPVLTTKAPVSGDTLFHDTFDGPDGLITNAFAYWSRDPAATRSDDWEVENGTLFRRGGAAWSGVPDGNDVDRVSGSGTGSQMFRMWTRRADFGDVKVMMRLRHEGWTLGDARWPVKSWDGLKIWLRRGGRDGDFALYTAEVNRRQGNVMIQKKCANSDEYTVLDQSSTGQHPPKIGEWEDVGGTVRTNPDGTVTVQVIRGGVVILTATDDGVGGCAPITQPGRVGIRAENEQFSIDDFVVSELR